MPLIWSFLVGSICEVGQSKTVQWLGGGQLKDVPHNILLRLGLSLNVFFQTHCSMTIYYCTPNKKGVCTVYLHFDQQSIIC